MSVGVLFTQGLVTGDPHRTLNEILAQAEAADRLGFDFALTTEHKYSDEYLGSPLHLSYAIAARWPYTSREAALSKFGDTALAMARTLFDYGAITDLPGVSEAARITLDEFVRDRFVFGTPDECVQTIGRFREKAGVDDFLMVFRYPTGPDHDAVLEAMELFGTEVLPTLDRAPEGA